MEPELSFFYIHLLGLCGLDTEPEVRETDVLSVHTVVRGVPQEYPQAWLTSQYVLGQPTLLTFL